jgi:hypothetical protein
MDTASSSSKPKRVRARGAALQIARSRFAAKRGPFPESPELELTQRDSRLRLLLAALVISAWVFMALRFGVSAWLLAPSGPPDATTSPNAAFAGLLNTANSVCPSPNAYFLVGDDIAVYQLADYYMYPRRATRIPATDPFDAPTLAGRNGDCVIAYGTPSMARIGPLLPELNLIKCAANNRSCLYIIK